MAQKLYVGNLPFSATEDQLRELFGKHFPAMTLVGARDLFDAPDGCEIEIQGVAVMP